MMDPLKTTVFLILLLNSYSSAAEYRLPDIVTPTFYHLFLTIDPENTDYSGFVNISLHTSNETKDIYIHDDTNFIEISTVILNNNAKCYVNSLNVTDAVKISCSRALLLDQDNSLYIQFTSKFSVDDGFGLVKSTYKDGEDEQIMIESNFKPTHARRAFPCLDEPDFKASFSVEITYPKGYTVLSNSPAASTTDVSGEMAKIKFSNTPEISPYLVDILISKLVEVEESREYDVDFRIYARSEVSSQTKNVAHTYFHQIIEQLDSFTGVPYQNLTEIGSYLVAVPDYSDATGDFGLFTYRETELLDEGDKTTEKAKQDIISTMAYKLTHEWYGGDVATKWWSDVWANEAIATYLKYIIPDKVDSELELTNQFMLEVTQRMLKYDGYSFAKPLSTKQSNVNDEWTIENELNTIISDKGASILRMLNYVLKGEDNFQSALQKHWQNRREADTDSTDILKDLLDGQGDGEDYYAYIENWVFSAGYPLLKVTLREDNITNIAQVTQKRFLYPTSETVESDFQWYVPLNTVTEWNHPNNIRVDVFLEPDQEMLYFFSQTWIIFNSRSGCFYRVNYDTTLWRRILYGLANGRENFHALERAQIIDDVFNIARIGDVSYLFAFQIADTLTNETEYYPWYSALNDFSYLLGKMENEGVEENLKNYILNLMENVIVIPEDNFVEDNDTHIDVLKKVMILNWACYLGHAGCISYATEKFSSYKKSQSLDDYNARGVIFCNGIRYSDSLEEDWKFLWDLYGTVTSVHVQNDILKSLGCAEDKDILQKYLQKIITTDSGIKRQDALLVFQSVLSSSLGLKAAMQFLENNISDIQNFFNDMRYLSEMIYAVAEKLITDKHIEWLNNLLSNNILDNYEDVRTKANVFASVNNYWKKNFQGNVTDIFPAPSYSTDATVSTTVIGTNGSTEPVSTTEQYSTTESKGDSISVQAFLFLIVMFVIVNFN